MISELDTGHTSSGLGLLRMVSEGLLRMVSEGLLRMVSEGLLRMVSELDTGHTSGGLGLLSLISELDTGQCASEDVGPREGGLLDIY